MVKRTRASAGVLAGWLAVALFAAAGCGDDNENLDASTLDLTVPGAADMTAAASDMRATTVDMVATDGAGDGAAALRNCIGIVSCLTACGTNTSCQDACIASGTPASQAAFQTLIMCAYSVCIVPPDGGTAACASTMDRSAGCAACLNTAGLSQPCMTQFTSCSQTM